MPRRSPNTPRSCIRAALRQLWLRSRERAAAMKRDGYCCQRCGVKQSRAKGREVFVQVHHRDGINWDGLITLVAERLLQTPERLETMCEECHAEKEKELAELIQAQAEQEANEEAADGKS